jgi:hypothetical protein
MNLLDEVTKGQPHFVFFPKTNKKGIPYNYDMDVEIIKMFLCQKSPVLKLFNLPKVTFILDDFSATQFDKEKAG